MLNTAAQNNTCANTALTKENAMTYVQYYQKSAISNALVPACGDRAVVILDGRASMCIHHVDARRFNGVMRPVYAAYAICKGRTFTNSKAISAIRAL